MKWLFSPALLLRQSRPKAKGDTLVCLLLLFTLVYNTSPAQTLNYTQYTTKDGLAGEQVHAIVQDRDGFIWFGTETGLSRFDGKQFRNFTATDGLPSNEILGLYIDSYDRIWICTFKNAICYYKQGKIHNQQNDPLLKKISLTGHVKGFGETDDNTMFIWDRAITFIKGDSVWTKPEGEYERYKAVFGTFGSNRELGLEAPSVLIKMPGSIKKLIKGGDGTCAYHQKGYYSVIYFKNRTHRLLVTWKGQKILHESIKRDLQYYRLQSDSSMWLADYNGVSLFDFRHGKTLASYFPGYTIYSVMLDREGNTWFATGGYGVFKLGIPRVAHYILGNGPISVPVQWLYKKDGCLYVGDDQSNFYRLEEKEDKDAPGLAAPSILSRKINGDIRWLKGSMERKFVNYSSSDFLKLKPGSIKGGIKSLYLFNDTLLDGESGGAMLLDLYSKKVLAIIHKGRATCAVKFRDQYFVGTLSGLYIYDRNLKLLSHQLGDRISYFAWNEQELWVASYDNGLYRYSNGVLQPAINERTGLSSNLCRCAFLSGHYLWIGTDKGLNKVDITQSPYKVVRKYNSADGLSTDIINTIYVEDSIVYVGTQKGLNRFIDHPLPQSAFCKLRLTDIFVSGRLAPVDSSLVLQHKDNNIRFQFSGISFLSGGDMTYWYRLLGLDDSWQTTREQSLSYPSLPSGSYTLQIMAVNKFGVRSPLLEKSFRIRKTLFEQWWFSAVALLIISGLGVLLVYLRIKRVQKRQDEKQRMDRKILELEQMALRAQMNPHFIFNCLNSIQNHIIRQDTEGASFYLTQFAGLVRQTLDNATRIYISLREEISYISSYLELERMQLGAAFEYQIDIDPDINPAAIRIPNMVTQPYIENAIKHGLSRMRSGGQLAISYYLSQESPMLECRIRDNGPGINAQSNQTVYRTHVPKGMTITQERVDMINKMYGKGQDITVLITDLAAYGDKGTQVLIRFPLVSAQISSIGISS